MQNANKTGSTDLSSTLRNKGKILCIGEALIDMICIDKGSSLANGNNFVKKAGGAPTNVAAAIAALGGSVTLAAKVGVDPFGKHLIETMHDFGVDTKWVLQDENNFTTFAFVSLLENGERDFYFNRGADGQLSSHDIASINLDEFAIIHFGSATAFLPGPLQQAYRELLQKAVQKNIFTSFDPNYRHLLFKNETQSFIEQSWNFLTQCNFFKLSDEEALLITGTATLADAAAMFFERTKAVFAITLGKEGAMLGINNNIVIVPGITAAAIDTTGAGDAFVGAVLYQLSENKITDIKTIATIQWQQIAANANKAAAKTCEYIGAMEAFKHLHHNMLQ